jgi:hypothetical protein
MSKTTQALKLFAATSRMIEHDLDQIEIAFVIDLNRGHRDTVREDEQYYPQIEQDIRSEAARMAPHYETFYSLEKTVRRQVADTLSAAEGPNWWNTNRVPQAVRSNAEGAQKREIDSGVTPRSDHPIDFCTFGELGEIIKTNWDLFGATFSSIKAVERVMSSLNTLRAPIAHCSLLAADEVLRLNLTVKDWFRLME